MKSHLSRILLSILILSLALQAFTLPAFAQSELNESQAAIENLVVPQKIDQPSFPDSRDAQLYPEDGIEIMPPELPERYQRYFETIERPDAIPPSPEIIAKTKAQLDSFDCSTVTDVPQIECEALVTFYESTNGAGWKYRSGWLQTTTVSTWRGVTVEMGRVTRIYLYNNQLTGSIPAALGNLSNLQTLNFGYNQLNGTIPAELGLLSNLEFLSLGSNELIGGIPAELGNLSNLDELYLSYNQLTGGIPSTLGNLANLHYLDLSYNQLTNIPAELGNLANLFELILSHNQLTSIPAELGNLSSLLALELYNNQLTSIPAELGNLANLKDLLLYNNQLTGRIPSSLGNLTNLETLYLFNNPLTGSIPLSFINLTKMSWFYTYETNLCEPTTPEFLAWKNTVVDWQGTGVICTEDRDFFECTTVTDVPQIECEALVALYDSTNGSGWTNNTNWLQSTTVSNWHGVTVGSGVIYLNLFANQLNGSIPAALGNLSNLELLTLGFNQLTGSIPSSLGNLSNLEILNLQSNQLTGSIPANLGSLTNLDTLYLYNNQLTGSIPSSLGNLSNLDYLGLAFNQLTGSIPSSLGNLSNLRDMWLNDNPLTGSIPAEIGNLSNLESLGLYRNQLTGSIPAELGNLANLETLLLYNNQLTGGIPADLGNLSELYDLALQNNPLTGSIPLSFVNLTKLDYFQFYETSLCEPTTPEFLAWKNTVDEWYGTGIVCGENLPPVALDDSYITPFNTTLSVSAPGVLSNDTDADNDALTAIKLSDPGSGTLTFNADGSFTYAPVPGFGGTVSFTYKANDGELDSNPATVSIMVGTNTAPVAQGQEVTTAEDTAKEITLTATDVDGQSLTYSIVGQASHGSLSLVAGNKVTYTPALNYYGPDSFTFKANDGFADSLPATVTITVTAVNDAPVAQNQTVTTDEDTAIAINLVATDVDSPTLTYSIVAQPTHGNLSALSGNQLTYTPNKDYNGTDSFTFDANDGSLDSNVATVTITVTPVNDGVLAYDDSYETFVNLSLVVDAEEGVLANDVLLNPEETVSIEILRAPENGTLDMNDDGSFTFVPKKDFWGKVTFEYRVHLMKKDGEFYDDATVTILVKPLVAIYLPIIFK